MLPTDMSFALICAGVGLGVACLVAFVMTVQSGRALTFAFDQREAKVPFLAIMLRILAGPAVVFAEGCRRLANRQEGLCWLVATTGAAASWCFLNGLMFVSSLSLAG